jgi:hypothetical protein
MSIPGVPAVPPSVNLFAQIVLLVADAINFLSAFGTSQWGIFQDGLSVVEADSVVSLGFKQDWAISTYATEQGGFQSYNRSTRPTALGCGFLRAARNPIAKHCWTALPQSLGTTELYDVVTPEQVYNNANIQQYSFQRSSQNGVGLIQVDVQLVEVRVTATADFTNPQSPNAAGRINDGIVQSSDASVGSASAVRASGVAQ